jgi:hypothetical protein
MRALLFIYITTILLMTTGCGPESGDCHKEILFYNNYEMDIYITTDGYILKKDGYPDTVYAIKYPPSIVSQKERLKIQSGEVSSEALAHPRGNCLEDAYHYYDTIMYYVLDAYTWEHESSQAIIDNYLVLQRYDLSLEDIRQLGWSLQFPPTEAMRHMKMYPPYETYNK